jgi:hypothetical protein
MTNKEQIQKDIAIALDFVEQIIDNTDLLTKIPEGAAITFLDEGNKKIEELTNSIPKKKYVNVKRYFEVL